jgi:hypothetical protein
MAQSKITDLTPYSSPDGAVDVCEICKNLYKTYPSWRSVRRTCSRICAARLKSIEKSGINHPLYGKHPSADTLKKISDATKGISKNIGKNNPMYGKPSWNAGRKVATNTGKTHFKKGMNPWNKGIKHEAVSGEKNHNWRGGVTKEHEKIRKSLEYKLWRKAVFERDNYMCVQCNARGVWIEADHIKQFAYHPEMRLNIDNGRTLCKPCHRKTDTWGNIFRDTLGRYSKQDRIEVQVG